MMLNTDILLSDLQEQQIMYDIVSGLQWCRIRPWRIHFEKTIIAIF
ncbi:MAG: hypothetical protein ABIP30_14225 [Ferruginibacter sp.]